MKQNVQCHLYCNYSNAPVQFRIVRIVDVPTTDVLLFSGSPTGDGGEFHSECLNLFGPRHAKASYKPWSFLQNLSMSSYYRSMNSSRRSTVSFSPLKLRPIQAVLRIQPASRFCVCPPQSCWRRKKSWWTVKCTCLPWGWPRPSSSRGSCLSWSSEGGQRREIDYAVARGSQRFRIEITCISPVMFNHMQLEFSFKLCHRKVTLWN